jgi:hypothetical protein
MSVHEQHAAHVSWNLSDISASPLFLLFTASTPWHKRLVPGGHSYDSTALKHWTYLQQRQQQQQAMQQCAYQPLCTASAQVCVCDWFDIEHRYACFSLHAAHYTLLAKPCRSACTIVNAHTTHIQTLYFSLHAKSSSTRRAFAAVAITIATW